MKPSQKADESAHRRAISRLLDWFSREARDLPWRRVRSSYSTWVSEVMLQQTTASVVTSRFTRFLRVFPDLPSLAAASEESVVAEWAGLGYYSRARALHRGARMVLEQHGGVLPRDETALRSLPGIGPYTAKAVRAFAFGERELPVDGNVARVLARYLGDGGDVSKVAIRRRLAEGLEPALPTDHPGIAAEALIELGALVCRPRDPHCPSCPMADSCRARRESRTNDLPRKPPARATMAVRSLRALLVRRGRLLLTKRPDDASMLPGFWELPGAWVADGAQAEEVLSPLLDLHGLTLKEVGPALSTARHTITHHRISAAAHPVSVGGRLRGNHARYLSREDLEAVPLTTETRKLLDGAGW